MLYARFVDTAGRLGAFAKARRKRCCGGRRCGRSVFSRFGGGWVFAGWVFASVLFGYLVFIGAEARWFEF